jgi:hypothetical protein
MTYLCIMGVDGGVELEVLDDDASVGNEKHIY